MNETTKLEMQLRSWAPRRPSAGLEERIFSPRPSPGDSPSLRFRLSWLAPAAAATFLMGVLFNHHDGQVLSGAAGSNPIVALAMSNQSAAAWFPGGFSPEQNSPGAGTFEWTNGGGSTSSIDSPFGSKGLR